MFKLLVVLACVAAARSGNVVVTSNPGYSEQLRHQDGHGNYLFGYDIKGPHGEHSAQTEKGDAYGNKVGSYLIHDVDGRQRRVDYTADAHGFRAVVNTNEQGTLSGFTANAQYNAAPVVKAVVAQKVVAPAAFAQHAVAAPAFAHHAVAAPAFAAQKVIHQGFAAPAFAHHAVAAPAFAAQKVIHQGFAAPAFAHHAVAAPAFAHQKVLTPAAPVYASHVPVNFATKVVGPSFTHSMQFGTISAPVAKVAAPIVQAPIGFPAAPVHAAKLFG